MANAADTWTGGSLSGAIGTDVVQKSFTISVNGATVSVSSGTTKNQFIQQLNAVGQKAGFTVYASGSVTGAAASGSLVFVSREYGSAYNFNMQFVNGSTGASSIASALTAGVDARANLILYSGGNGIGGTAGSGGTAIAFTATGNGTGLRLVSTGGSVIVLASNVASGLVYGAINGTTGGASFQVGPNVGQTAEVTIQSMHSTQLGIGGSGTYLVLGQLRGSSLISGNAGEALKVIDKAIDDITTTRGNLGAFQSSTLETTINNMRVTTENLTAAESTIRDADFAMESAQFTRNNILVQASTAMMAQANQLPQNVLQLLG
jgi:flagellin